VTQNSRHLTSLSGCLQQPSREDETIDLANDFTANFCHVPGGSLPKEEKLGSFCHILYREVRMQEAEVREKLREFIVRELIRDEEYDLENDEGIITGGLMDSFALAEFGVFVEQEFDVYIPDADLTVAKMDTLDQMVVRVLNG
jgi:acyl carrier protein